MAKKKTDKVQQTVLPPDENPSKEDISAEIFVYLKEQLPLLNTLTEKFSSMSKKQNANIQAKITNLDKKVNNIHSTLKDANEQREMAASFAEEQILEDKKEQAVLEEKRAATQEKQNSVIITKLTDLNESIGNIELPDVIGSRGGGLLDAGIDSLAKLALGILQSPLFLAPAVALIGYHVGKYLSETYIAPQIDKAATTAKEISGVEMGMIRKDVVTDTGEKVFSKVSDTGETSLVTESQMQKEIEALPEDQREKAKEQYSQKIDQYDPITGMRLGGRSNYVESGITIQQMNQQLGDQESFKLYDEFFAAVLDFDKEFRKKMIDVTKAYKITEDESGWQIAQSQYLPVLESMATEQNILINRINKSNLSERQKENLFSVSPLFEGAKENKASTGSTDYGGIGAAPISAAISGIMGYDQMLKDIDYTLPSGITIDIEDLNDNEDPIKVFNEMVPPINETTQKAMSGIPQLETGGVVYPKTREGVLVNISENMKPEAIVPLDQYNNKIEEINYPKTREGVLVNISENIKPEAIVPLDQYNNKIEGINLSEKATEVIRSSYFEEKDATESQTPIVINNMNNVSGGGGGVESANYQFQTDLSKTFDNVFDMILEKNYRTGIV